MGIDLTLYIPINKYTDETSGFICHNKLDLQRNSDFFNDVKKLTSYLCPNVYCYSASTPYGEDTYYGIVTTDHYGKPLQYVHAGDLANVMMKHITEFSEITTAATQFINCLSVDYPIVLYWN